MRKLFSEYSQLGVELTLHSGMVYCEACKCTKGLAFIKTRIVNDTFSLSLFAYNVYKLLLLGYEFYFVIKFTL